MLLQIVVVGGLVCFLVNLILNLRSLRAPGLSASLPATAPLVSVLVPARNEEGNICACLECLRNQDYPNYEVIVLDDNSTDGTFAKAMRVAESDRRVRVIAGAPLPSGWSGKAFACYQLAKAARGEWLLFVDADTRHEPHMLRSIMTIALKDQPSLLCGFPRQLTTTFLQKVVIPVFYFIILAWAPLWWLQRCQDPKLSVTIGQFFLFRRDEYWRVGGHEAVRSKITEDIWLGAEVCRRGGRVMLVDLSPIVSCHMYDNLKSMWHGFAKNIYSVAAFSPVTLFGLMAVGYLFFLAPFHWLWNDVIWTSQPPEWGNLIIAQVSIILLMRYLLKHHFKESIFSTVLHPIGLSFFFIDSLWAFWRRMVGTGIQWKGREYSRRSGIE
ncbi:MAG: glycosyltransferase [Dehalococcoidia bacterium]|nr:glycosyltransferase [Dehalococcoidia bacterium]